MATIGGVPITRAELEESLAAELERVERERHKILEQGLDPLIERRLLEAEAERRGTTPEALIEAETTSRTEPVTDEQVEAWYQANASRLQNRPKEQLLPQIETFLGQQAAAQARGAFLDELRGRQEVVVHFEPLRVSLDLEDATLKGPSAAPVTIVEFSDFQCPACRSFNPILTQVLEAYGDRIQVAFRQFPLRSIHPQAQPAAEASLCAREQGKFWEVHDAMFADQRSLEPPQLKELARRLGLDGEAFDECFDEGRHRAVVDRDLARGQQVGVTGTPSVFVNGREVAPGRVPSFEEMKALVDDELRRAQQR
ncbi:MAG TPA: thioredoxin domain-containing protein [Thermoanaerobaculia bacterium]|nr:thioredoxin domain-containing protein [Thermoanaerobaculia bacterium]